MANNYGGNFPSFSEYLQQNQVRQDRQSYPFYSDNADYNTNSKSYYDYLSRINKIIEVLAKRIWEYDEELAKRFEEWDKNLEELPEDLEKLLVGWMEDGTLDDIINKNIFKDLNDKIDTINSKLNHFIVNIEEFDGSDCERIQKALDLVHSKGGGVVYVPRHSYDLDCELVIYQNTTLYSEIGTVYNRRHKGYMLMNGDRGSNYNGYNGNGNLSIINGTFDGKAQDDLGGTGSNIAIAHADNIIIDNVEILNANSHHIELNSSKNVIIQNSKILGQLSNLQYVEGIQLDLATKSGFGAFGSFDSTGCKNVTIQDCIFGESDDLPSLSRGVGTHSIRIGVYIDNIKIINNRFNNLRDFSIQFLGYKDSLVTGNKFDNCAGGIVMYSSDPENDSHITDKYGNTTTDVQPTYNVTVENNVFDRIYDKQIIYAYGREKSNNKQIIIRNNKIKDSVDNSGIIMSRYTDDSIIENNKIVNVGRFGILVEHSTNVMVNNNNIDNTLSYSAIRIFDTCRYISVSNNIINKAGGNAINILEDNHSVIISNNLIGGANGNNEDYDAIYMHTDGNYVNINNNVIRVREGYEYESAIYVTQTVENGVRLGNISEKGKNIEKYRTANVEDKGDI